MVTAEGVHLSESQLKGYVRDNLARFKVPREVADEVPRNPTGKVIKAELLEQCLIGHLLPRGRDAGDGQAAAHRDQRRLGTNHRAQSDRGKRRSQRPGQPPATTP